MKLPKLSSLFITRGILAILFALLAFFLPGATLAGLVLLWGAFALVDGVMTLYNAFKYRTEIDHWWVYLLHGVSGIGIGVITFLMPGVTAIVLLWLIAAWAVLAGVFMILAAIHLRKEIQGEVFLGLAGVLSILFGIYVFVQPGGGAVALVWMIGGWALLLGVLLLIVGMKLRGLRKDLHERVAAARA